MKQRKDYTTLAVFGAFLLAMSYGAVALALTAAPAPTDYATDVQAGQATLQADPVAAASAKEVNDSESDAGDVDNEAAEVKEAIEPAEATEPAEAGESGGSDSGGQSNGGASGETGGQR